MTLRNSIRLRLVALATIVCLQGCSPGGDGSGSDENISPAVDQNLTVANVETILSQAIAEAIARGISGTVAIVDRVGNILAVFRMDGAATTATITSGRGVTTGLEGLVVADTLAAIAKAVTGAYLSSRGNAFTTRTANQIIQEHFNPGELLSPGGPLFGVQFSQLPCSDLNVVFIGGGPLEFIGPKRSPLGLSADPGGLPLYKDGDLVGGIGVITDGVYGLDLNISDFDTDNDELVAIAGTVGFDAPSGIRANRITVEGKSLRYTDRDVNSLISNPQLAPPFIDGLDGQLLTVRGYFDGAIVPGRIFGQAASGIRPDNSAAFSGINAFVLVDGADNNRFPPIDGTTGGGVGLTAAEVTTILTNALETAFSARAQIRRPLNSHAQVTVSVVDDNGAVLGIVRTPDAPIFGIDVSLQKARTAALFSNTEAAGDLIAAGANIAAVDIGDFVANAQAFVGPNALTDGTAFSDRAGGNLARPFYPDGVDGNPNGPFSRPFPDWSPFSTGLQEELILDNLAQHLAFVGGAPGDTVARCTNLPLQIETGSNRAANGIQIFPGSVPIYRVGILVGGVGVSGDGIDQDDLVAFLGLHNAGLALGTGVGNAPIAIRADNLSPQGTALRYVNCPFTPFLDSNEQNVCAGK
ncbi:MAG: heme-binding protein [Alphaproteobacteria bacterium]|nr:heme-binding protein [Alphaproteobacteria bacterium]